MAKKKLDDPHLQDRLFDAIRLGNGKWAACKAVGISPDSFRRYWKENPDFREAFDDALDASSEPVVAMFRELAIDGDVTAGAQYMKHAGGVPRSERDKNNQKIEIEVTHAIDPAQIKSIQELEDMVRNRALPPAPVEFEPEEGEWDYIEGDIIDD